LANSLPIGWYRVRTSRKLLFGPVTEKLELLLTPLSRLDLSVEDGATGEALAIVREDLHRMHLRKLNPFFYLSTGYGTVEGTTNIAVGFYDANPLIRELHKEYRKWLYSPDEIVATLRHEIGHAFCYAYKLYRRKDFREIFNVHGHFFRTYPVTNRYVERANPWSRDFVNPMGDHYAQKHPDDDFAETFCVWLTPRANWRREYRLYPGALIKLAFVDRVIRELRRTEPEIQQDPSLLDEPLSESSMTLAEFLHAQPSHYRHLATGYVDSDMRKLFHRPPVRSLPNRNWIPAATFLQEMQPLLTPRVVRWIRVDPLIVKDFLEKCSIRASALSLGFYREEREKKAWELSSLLSMRCTLFAHNGLFY
jgi:hypothetical protein